MARRTSGDRPDWTVGTVAGQQESNSAEQRGRSAQERLDAADRRDVSATARDVAALKRDRAADAHERAIAHAVTGARDGVPAFARTDAMIRAVGERKRAAQQRTQDAEQSALAAADRHAAARDRERAADDRVRAAADRAALARQLSAVALDAVTGAQTRAAGLLALARELDRCRRNHAPLVVAHVAVGATAMVDRDDATDAALDCVAALLAARLRSYDLIIRLDATSVACALSQMRQADVQTRFAELAAALAEAPYAITIRTGLAAATADETAWELIARATAASARPPGRLPRRASRAG